MNSLDRGLLPAHARRGDFVPVKGGDLYVTLPGELVRTTVLKLFSRDICTVKIVGLTLNKGGATQRTGDEIAVKRAETELSETWVPISDREVREDEERQKAARFAKEEAERQAREEAERKVREEAEREAAELAPEVTRVTEMPIAAVAPAPERPAAARPRKRGTR